jgi:hypothetical protein
MLERDIEERVVRYAKKRGCLAYKFTSPQRRGVPDRLIIAPGGFQLFLELKATKAKPSLLQLKEMSALEAQGCFVRWSDDVDTCKRFIDQLLLLS